MSTCLPSLSNYFSYPGCLSTCQPVHPVISNLSHFQPAHEIRPVNLSTQYSNLLLVSCQPSTQSIKLLFVSCQPVDPIQQTPLVSCQTVDMSTCLPSLSNYFSYPGCLSTCRPVHPVISNLSHFQPAHEIHLKVKKFHIYRHCIRFLPYIYIFLLFISVTY